MVAGMRRHLVLLATAACALTGVQLAVSLLVVHELRPLVLYHASGRSWQFHEIVFAAGLLLLPLAFGRDPLLGTGLTLVASGVAANALSVSIWPGVVDFFPAAGWLLSVGDLAIMAGAAVALAGTVRAILRFPETPPVIDLLYRLIWGD